MSFFRLGLGFGVWSLSLLAIAQPDALRVSAAVLSGERPVSALSSISKKAVQAELSPLLHDSADSASYVVAAFALAMKGVDVDTNVARLVAPIRDSNDEKIDELLPTHGLAENQVLLEDIPNAIYLIYKTRHDANALKTLLTMPVDWPAAEYRDDCIMSQLRSDPKPVLALAMSDAKIYATLWDIIDWNVGTMTDRKAFVHRLETDRWPSDAIRKTAFRLAHDVATPKNRPDKN